MDDLFFAALDKALDRPTPAWLRPARKPQTPQEQRAHDLTHCVQPATGYQYGSICDRCGGTPNGEGPRCWVGVCGCGSAS